jgi:hypothetical protein
MADREFTVRLPSDVAARLAAGEDVTSFVGDAIRHQVRREAIATYLSDCDKAGLAPLSDDDLEEFRQLVGEDVRTYHLVYDTNAVVGHVTGTSRRLRAGLRLILDEPDLRLLVPAVCLLEAYAQTSSDLHHLLDELATNPGVFVGPGDPDPRVAVVVGKLAAETGRAGAAHAAHMAIEGQGPAMVFTDTVMPTEVLARPT